MRSALHQRGRRRIVRPACDCHYSLNGDGYHPSFNNPGSHVLSKIRSAHQQIRSVTSLERGCRVVQPHRQFGELYPVNETMPKTSVANYFPERTWFDRQAISSGVPRRERPASVSAMALSVPVGSVIVNMAVCRELPRIHSVSDIEPPSDWMVEQRRSKSALSVSEPRNTSFP